jgi:hypothetical protein
MSTRFHLDIAALKCWVDASGKPYELISLEIDRTKETLIAYLMGRIVPPVPVVLALCDSLGCHPEDLLRPVEPDPATVIANARRRSRRAQGLPEKVTDPAALDEAAHLFRRRA